MIEITLLNYLKDTMSVPCYLQIPENPADSYIRIERTSGAVNNHIKSARFAIQSIAPTMYGAALLNEEVKSVMDAFVTVDSISKSKLNSDYNFTDTTKKNYRYQAVYDLVFYD